MKRPALVIASAVVLVLLSLTQILMALLMVLAGTVEHTHGLPARPGAAPTPAWLPLFSYGLAAVCAGLAAWGIVTAIGVYRLRRWARILILIIGGCMAFIGGVLLVSMVITFATFSSFAPTSTAVAPGSAAIVKAAFAVGAFLYAAIAAIGIFWLVYFNRATVRSIFTGGLEAGAESRRPLLISMYAIFSLLSAPSCAVMAFLPLPTVLYGVPLQGWKKVAIDLLLAAINVAVGIGLWKVAEWARRLALAYLAFGGSMIVAYLIWPSLLIRNSEAVAQAMGVAPAPLPNHVQMAMYAFIFGFSLLFMAAIAWMLHYYRGRFAPPAPTASVAGA